MIASQSLRATLPFLKRFEMPVDGATRISVAILEICRRQPMPGGLWKYRAAESCPVPADRSLPRRI
jgi:hypothetical protein